MVTEIEDAELGVKYRRPIRRLLDAGAETYLAATAIPRWRSSSTTLSHDAGSPPGCDPARLAIEPSSKPRPPPE